MAQRKEQIPEHNLDNRAHVLAIAMESVLERKQAVLTARNFEQMVERLKREKAEQEKRHKEERVRLIAIIEQTMNIVQMDKKFPVKNDMGFKLAVSAMQKEGIEGTLLLIDVDKFKSVNDTFGHINGDRALEALAIWLNNHFRASDVVARWGGEEFIIFCPKSSPKEIHEKLRSGEQAEGTAKINVPVVYQRTLPGEPAIHQNINSMITVSGGLVTLKPGQKIEDAVRRADEILYAVKQSGRDRIDVEESNE